MSKRILCVDDEPKVLDAFKRQLCEQFDMETAVSGAQGLEVLASKGPFAVIVSDMRMPGMDGIQFLTAAKDRAPESVRVMLTGNADQQTAIDAVNEGNIFRFLTKPCPPEKLGKALTAGIEQYRLVMAEKELLEETLRGAIKVLSEVLSLTNPTAFGHASRVQRLIRKLCQKLRVDKLWEIEIAAMLSQIGCVTIPSDTLENVYHGRTLQEEESRMLEAHPAVGRDLVANIPRLENVAQIIAYQQKGFDGSGNPQDDVAGNEIPLGARILKAAIDYDTRKWGGLSDFDIIIELRQYSKWYDPDVLNALEAVSGFDELSEIRTVRLKDLETYAILADDVTTPDGTLIVAKGQEVTFSLHQRLRNFARTRGLEDQMRVRVCVQKSSRKMATT